MSFLVIVTDYWWWLITNNLMLNDIDIDVNIHLIIYKHMCLRH